MKKAFLLTASLLTVFTFGGCAAAPVSIPESVSVPERNIPVTISQSETAAPEADTGVLTSGTFGFVYNGIAINLGEAAENVLDALGPQDSYYTYPSCAFDGDAKIYVYDSFEISTYVKDKTDYDSIYSVTLLDGGAETPQGVCIGMTYDGMVSAYGTEYEEIPGSYIYRENGAALSFDVDEGNTIISISYFAESGEGL